MKDIIVTLAIFTVMSCAPVISQEGLKDIDKNLRFEWVLENPDEYKGKSILLGGTVIETEPLSDKTLILVLQRPLGYREKPSTEKESKGRFIIVAPEFLDPAIYRAGRQLTVVGPIVGREMRPLGKIEYSYPLIAKKELYLWPLEETTNQPRFHFGIGIGKTF